MNRIGVMIGERGEEGLVSLKRFFELNVEERDRYCYERNIKRIDRYEMTGKYIECVWDMEINNEITLEDYLKRRNER